jgi:hypothetical protein
MFMGVREPAHRGELAVAFLASCQIRRADSPSGPKKAWRGATLFAKIYVFTAANYSGVVQLVALQTLDLAILVRVQAPEPLHAPK